MAVKFVFIFLTLLLISATGIGQEKQTYSLAEAIDQALRNNPDVLMAQKEIEAAKGRKLQAISPEQPELNLAWEGIESGGSLSKAKERNITLSQNLEFPSKYILKRGVGQREFDIALENLGRIKSLVAARVKGAYYKVKYFERLVETLEFTLGLLNQFRDATLFKYQAGELPYFEVIRAKVEIAKTQNEILEAKKELQTYQTELNLILGRFGSEELNLTDELIFVPFQESKEQTLPRLTQQSKSLKIARLTLEKEAKNLSLARSSFIPDLSLTGGMLSEGGQGYIPSFGVGITLPLWWWNPKGQIQENRANLQIAETRKQALERIVKGKIERAFDLVQASQEQVELFEKTLLKEVDEELKAGINSYQYNQIDALGLLDIYRTNKTTKTEYYKTLYNYLSALADLEVAGETSE
ncbi:MAG: hypothetical protein A2V86_04340 [Deltaproteobacteria bacterium RBG_16_49_23]|nr:MAG: hypothetical protein A2V86_04340 [Deltaproteobacteria bacterium RBG_16_49_23]